MHRVGDTLLEKFTAEEIETVLAHELGHHIHKDIPLGIIIQSGLTLVGFWLADLVMRWGIAIFGYSPPGAKAAGLLKRRPVNGA